MTVSSSKPRVAVVGFGAIGGVISAHLLELGVELTAVTTNPAIARAVSERGVRIRGEPPPRVLRPAAVVERLDERAGLFDLILLTTQPPQVEQAALTALPHLAPDGRIVCFQNGLCEERLAPLVGAERIVGAVVAWGASTVEPGCYDRTSQGGFVLGRLDGATDAPLEALGRLLESVGPVTLTTNLRGARWSKLAINCGVSTLGTIGADRLGALMRRRYVRRLMLDIVTETVAVARAEGVTLEKVSGTVDLDWLALTDAEQAASGSPGLVAKHTLLLAVGARYRRLRSSMLSAIERGRTPAIDFLNGEVVQRAGAHGLSVPVNRAARELVWEIARGNTRASHRTLHQLYLRTRNRSAALGAGEG
jgi:2-dehydropantoate 2-reductase